MNGAREDLLSYKLSIIKVLVGIMCWIACLILRIWMEQTGRPISGAFVMLRVFLLTAGIIFVIKGLVESIYTFENRKLQKLNCMNIDEIRSVRQESIGFFSVFKKNNHAFCIFKNEVDVFRIGAVTIYKGKAKYAEIDYKYYYIDEIKNRRIERVKYRDYQEFKRAVNQLNGNRDTFDIVMPTRARCKLREKHRIV